MIKKKYIIKFLIKEHGIYTVVKAKRFNPLDTKIDFRNKSYIIDINIPTYRKTLKQFYFIDIKKTENCQLIFYKNKNTSIITPEIMDLIVSKSIIKQLTSNLTDTAFKMNLMYVIFGAIIGGLIGWIAGGF